MAMKIIFLSLPLTTLAGVVASLFEDVSEMTALDRPASTPRLFTSQRYGDWSSQKAMSMDGACQPLKNTDDL